MGYGFSDFFVSFFLNLSKFGYLRVILHLFVCFCVSESLFVSTNGIDCLERLVFRVTCVSNEMSVLTHSQL